MRVAPEVELEGLDIPEFGLKGYPEDATSLWRLDLLRTA
jgi:hypothetical protein